MTRRMLTEERLEIRIKVGRLAGSNEREDLPAPYSSFPESPAFAIDTEKIYGGEQKSKERKRIPDRAGVRPSWVGSGGEEKRRR